MSACVKERLVEEARKVFSDRRKKTVNIISDRRADLRFPQPEQRQIQDGLARVPDRPGIGLTWRPEAVKALSLYR
jgi:pentatricopeptide repeat protein